MSGEAADGQAGKTWILKVDHDDPERELEFELSYQRSLTTGQRFDMMFRMSRLMAEMLARQDPAKYGRRSDTEITKRA
jgi:hypothetical protein